MSTAQQFSVTKEVEFDAGHRVPMHDSKCRNPHGHRYKVAATVCGELQPSGSSTGMVLDFSHIKRLLTERVHDKYDHGFIVHSGDFEMLGFLEDAEVNDWNVHVVDWMPTAEELARNIYDELCELVACMGENVWLQDIKVWETPTSLACYGS